MSDHGRELLTQLEGFRTKPYADEGGKQTIGIGHLLTQAELDSGKLEINGVSVPWRHGISQSQVADLLRQDLTRYEDAVERHVEVPLTQNQFDALVSFTFNLGEKNLADSTLLKRVNARAFDDVPTELRRWVKVGTARSQGLANRREREIELWQSGTHPKPTTPAQPRRRVSTPATSYTVAAGDTLESVARRFGTTVAELANANDIINPADFKPGRVVTIPTSAGDPIPQPTPSPVAGSYTVVAGDTLESVARRFGTTVAELANANDIINPADFKPGRVVTIPTPGSDSQRFSGRLNRREAAKNTAQHLRRRAAVVRQLVSPTVVPGVDHREQVEHIRAVQQFGRDLDMGIDVDGIAGPLTYGLTLTLQLGMIDGPYLDAPVRPNAAPGPATTAMLEYSRENGFRCSKNFRWKEFDTQNPDRVVSESNHVLLIDRQLIILAQKIRDHVGFAFSPVSAYRDPVWNDLAKGTSGSQHMLGKAIDIESDRLRLTESEVRQLGATGVGIVRATGFVRHVDTRDSPAKWFY